jgi:hypothetical protein
LRYKVDAGAGIIVVRDPAEPLPAPSVREDDDSALLEAARSGHLFALLSDDPLRCRVDVYAREPVPADADRDFEPAGGAFLLLTPSRRVAAASFDPLRSQAADTGEPLAVPSERCVVQLRQRRPFDARRHEAEMRTLLGDADWAYTRRVDRLGLAGCLVAVLPLAAAFVALVGRRWHGLLLYALPLVLVAWAPFWVMRATARYRAGTRRMKEHEERKPHYIVTVRPADERTQLEGGFVRV